MCENTEVSMDVLLAIKPEFAQKILTGTKGYEFRRSAFQDDTETDLIFLYASAPVSKIVGLFTSNRTVEASPADLWDLYGNESGINDEDRFMSYFEGVETGFAIQVDETYQFEEPIPPDAVLDDFSPPMSFNYLNAKDAESLRKYVPESFQTQTVATDLTQFE